MSDFIKAIKETREIASEIANKSLLNIKHLSEVELREKILSEVLLHNNLFPKGWYDPPPSGVGILFDATPFKRLQFSSLRDEKCFPNKNCTFENESVGMVYFSPIDKVTNMIGDIGLTVYNGNNEKIKQHIKKCYDTTYAIADYAKVGMTFSELFSFAMDLFKNEFKLVEWMTTTSDPNKGINLGHTIPGSFGEGLEFGNSFEQVRETITKNRIYINQVENFQIPQNCAFTVEARLADVNDPELPNTFFHFIVTFDNGQKEILENFENIFKTVNMNYLLKN